MPRDISTRDFRPSDDSHSPTPAIKVTSTSARFSPSNSWTKDEDDALKGLDQMMLAFKEGAPDVDPISLRNTMIVQAALMTLVFILTCAFFCGGDSLRKR